MSAPPSVPPRPARTKDDAPPEPASLPAVPPRPKRAKSPPPGEPAVTTIAAATELRAPQARAPVRPPVRKNTGIPVIGSRVPMYPNAGDVQMPAAPATPAGRKNHVYREEWELDEGAYGSKGTPRPSPYTRSSNDLNRSVAGAPAAAGSPVPDEEIGYLATERFARAIAPPDAAPGPALQDMSLADLLADSPAPADADRVIHLDPPTHHHHPGNHHQHRVPGSRPGTRPSTRPNTRPASPTKHYRAGSDAGGSDGDDTETEPEHEHPILASDEVLKRAGQGFMLPAVSPPLPAWRPGSTASSRPQSVHPAARDADSDADVEPAPLPARGGSVSRDSLLLSSLEAGDRPEPLFPDSDPEDAPAGARTPAAAAAAAAGMAHEKLKRPGMPEPAPSSSGHKFPSKDVWEEAPDFSQLEATVSSRPPSEHEHTDTDEHPPEQRPEVPYIHGQPSLHYVPGDEVEFERAQKKPAGYRHQVSSSKRDDGLDRLLKRGSPADDPDKLGVARAKAKRFPSNDIWEDVPPSLELSASVTDDPAADDEAAVPDEPAATEPAVEATPPAAAPRGRATPGISTDKAPQRPTAGASPIEAPSSSPSKPTPPARPAARPTVPATRPALKPRTPSEPTADKKPPPGVPDRPKPKVPIDRPTRASSSRSPVDPPQPPAAKPKPSIPPRTGGKIAALKAGFLSDLDNRLKLGPVAVKKDEEESVKEGAKEAGKEKTKLEDVRKGRAKGPRGRKLPTVEKVEAKEKKEVPTGQALSVGVWSVWSIGEEGVEVGARDVEGEEKAKENVKEIEEPKEKEEVKEEVKVKEVKEKEEPKEEEPKEKEVKAPTTSTLPGVTGTGIQTVPSLPAQKEPEDTPPVASPTAAEEKEEKGQLPTLAPADEHPEDAPPAAEPKGSETATERARVDDTDEVAAAGGSVANTEGDARVEV